MTLAPSVPGNTAGANVEPGVALELRDLSKRYGATEAVRAVNLRVREGEMITLLGPSGSGKTTVLKLVAGFTDLSGGAIYLRGQDVSALSPGERNIGMVFQNYALFPHMTVAENVGYGLKMQRVAHEERATRVTEMLELVGLPGYQDRLPRELSGGQQQRVALARALAFGPSLLLMDEPLGALDRELRDRMMVELKRVHQEVGVTALYVTHDREEALTLSDRVAIMRDGRLEGVGTPAELLTGPPSRFIATFFGGHALLPARVVAAAEAGVVVECLGQRVAVASTSGSLRPGEDAEVVVPSSAVTVEQEEDVLRLDLSVLERLDLGDRIRVTAEIIGPDGGALPTLLRLSLPRHQAAGQLTPRSRVEVGAQLAHLSVVS